MGVNFFRKIGHKGGGGGQGLRVCTKKIYLFYFLNISLSFLQQSIHDITAYFIKDCDFLRKLDILPKIHALFVEL